MKNYLIKDSTVVPMVRDHEYSICDILIQNGKIHSLGKNLKAPKDSIEIDAKDCITLPGFIQGHIHLVQSLLRHQADDLELLDWLKQKTWPYEASLSGDEVQAASELGAAELLLGGTTTICDFGTTHSHERVFKVVDEMGLRYIGGKTMMNMGEEVPQALMETTEQSLTETYDLGKKWHGHEGRIHYAVTPRFAVSCTEDLMKNASRLARDNKWYLQTHSNENKSEIELVQKITGLKNIPFLEKVGFVGEDTILAHCVHLEDSDFQILKKTHTRVCHCPGSNLKLASGIAPVPRMLKEGLHVLLGADGAPCNNRLSIFHEMTLAATLHKVNDGPKSMPAWTVLRMATQAAAKALRLDHEIGTLEVGKKADLVILKKNSLSLYPDGDPASQVVYGAHQSDVHYVFIDGNPKVMASQLVDFSVEDIQENSKLAWNAVAKKMKELI